VDLPQGRLPVARDAPDDPALGEGHPALPKILLGNLLDNFAGGEGYEELADAGEMAEISIFPEKWAHRHFSVFSGKLGFSIVVYLVNIYNLKEVLMGFLQDVKTDSRSGFFPQGP